MRFCPRCGNDKCFNPDSKECSDNLIEKLTRRLARAHDTLARYQELLDAAPYFPEETPHQTLLKIIRGYKK